MRVYMRLSQLISRTLTPAPTPLAPKESEKDWDIISVRYAEMTRILMYAA